MHCVVEFLCHGCRLLSRGLAAAVEDVECHVKDLRVVQDYVSTVGSRFDVNTHIGAKIVVRPAEVVPNRLWSELQLVGNLVDATLGELALDATKFVECNSPWHNDKYR